MLIKWNQRINLVGPRELEQLWHRHIPECLHLATFIPDAPAVFDLGSGAGFPGLLIAIARECPVTLIEADHRKAAFLRECGRELELPISVVTKRAEALGGIEAEVITARAFAPLNRLLRLARPLLKPHGRCFLLKGARVDAELTEARREWQMSVKHHPGLVTGNGCILEVSDFRPIHPAG